MGDARLANLLGVAALAAGDRMRAAVEAELDRGGGAPAALVHLQAYPGESVEALRRVLGISQPAKVRMVDGLAAAGLLERRPGGDRRTLALHLTAAGEAAATRLLERRGQLRRDAGRAGARRAGGAAPAARAARLHPGRRPAERVDDVPAVRPRGLHQRPRLPMEHTV